MKLKGWGFEKSYEYVKFQRPLIAPNPGFVRQLQIKEAELSSAVCDNSASDTNKAVT